MNLPQQSIEQILGSSSVNREFGEKVKELDRRLKMNGMSYLGYESLTDRQQEILTQGLFLEPTAALGMEEYVRTALDNCGCVDVEEDLHHHSPILMREIDTEKEKLPDLKIKIGESLSGLDQTIDLLLEQILNEEKAKIVPYKESEEFTPEMRGYVRNSIAKANNLKFTDDTKRKGPINKFASPLGQDNAELEDLKPFFKKYGFDIDETDISKSGQYYSYVLTATRDFTKEKDKYEFPRGTQVIYVPLVMKTKEGQKKSYIINKSLAPGDGGLAVDQGGKPIGKQQLMESTAAAVNRKYTEELSPVADQLISILESSNNSGNAIALDRELDFSDKDFKTISKDYGEILSGVWALNEQKADFLPFSEVSYPAEGNYRLVDFFGISDDPEEPRVPVSVKSGGGSKVAITNIIEAQKLVVDSLPPQNAEFLGVAATNKFTQRQQVIELNKILKQDPANPESEKGSSGIRAMAKVMGVEFKELTYEKVNQWCFDTSVDDMLGNKHPNAKELGLKKPALLQPVWDATGTTPKLDVYLKRLDTPSSEKEWRSLVAMSPLGQSMSPNLNANVSIKEEFNRLARALTVIQNNIDVKKKVLRFSVHKFSEANFKFDWPGYVSGNKLGFIMEINK